jgi:hypothetical protein
VSALREVVKLYETKNAAELKAAVTKEFDTSHDQFLRTILVGVVANRLSKSDPNWTAKLAVHQLESPDNLDSESRELELWIRLLERLSGAVNATPKMRASAVGRYCELIEADKPHHWRPALAAMGRLASSGVLPAAGNCLTGEQIQTLKRRTQELDLHGDFGDRKAASSVLAWLKH